MSALKEVLITLADDNKKRGKLRFQKRVYEYKNWLAKNKDQIKSEIRAAQEKLVEAALGEALGVVGPDDENTKISLTQAIYEILEHVQLEFMATIKSLGIKYEDIQKILVNEEEDDDDDDEDDGVFKEEKYFQYVIDQYADILHNEGFYVEEPDASRNNIEFYISWGTLGSFHNTALTINWVEVYDWVQLTYFHCRMVEKIVDGDIGENLNTTQTKKLKAFHNKKEKEYEEKIRSVFTDVEDTKDRLVIDLEDEYDAEIDTWLDKVVVEKNIGKEPEKKLKLGDPR